MATHSSVLAWRIPGTGEPEGLPSMGSHRVGHNWSDLAAAVVHVLNVMDINFKIVYFILCEIHLYSISKQLETLSRLSIQLYGKIFQHKLCIQSQGTKGKRENLLKFIYKNGEICLKYYTCLNINLNKRKLPIKNGQNTRTERE